MTDSPRRLLLIGSSVRAAADSARRAGIEVFAIDRFGDEDLRQIATALPIGHWPDGIIPATNNLPSMSWMYSGAVENEPSLIAAVSQRHRLLGNPPDVLSKIRDPFWIESRLLEGELPALQNAPRSSVPAHGEWLLKPLRGGGGQGIEVWNSQESVPSKKLNDSYFQQRRVGRSISGLFVAFRNRTELIGLSEQLIGREMGAPNPFGYAGSIGPIEIAQRTRQLVEQIGRELSQAATLRGLFGIDFVLDGDVPWLTEVNPRYTASVELLEWAWKRQLIGEHIAACESFNNGDVGSVPQVFAGPVVRKPQTFGKLIVYADADVVAPVWDDLGLGVPEFTADIPQPGSRIPLGWPICTVFASGDSQPDVQRQLVERSAIVREQMIR